MVFFARIMTGMGFPELAVKLRYVRIVKTSFRLPANISRCRLVQRPVRTVLSHPLWSCNNALRDMAVFRVTGDHRAELSEVTTIESTWLN